VAPRSTTETDSAQVVERFHRLYYDSYERTWGNTRWLGIDCLKCPLDLWVYQEILSERRPDVIVETGTSRGGSALFLASICDMLNVGRVITVDVRPMGPAGGWPAHPRLEYLTGSSVAPETVQAVHEAVGESRAMVVLDSDHSHEHVLAELRAYSPLVGPGDYLIVEDTNGPGPRAAVDEFLAEVDSFEIDAAREKFYMTHNPGGYLRRQ
jgi:cephalosporin hydroxylase